MGAAAKPNLVLPAAQQRAAGQCQMRGRCAAAKPRYEEKEKPGRTDGRATEASDASLRRNEHRVFQFPERCKAQPAVNGRG